MQADRPVRVYFSWLVTLTAALITANLARTGGSACATDPGGLS